MMTKGSMIVAAALVALTTAAAGFAHNATRPGVTVLAHRATTLLHSRPIYAKAVLLEAEGTTPHPRTPVKTADAIETWRFVFDNQASHNKYKSVSITSRRGLLGVPKGSLSAFLQDQPINPIPNMTLTRAIQLLNAAGYTKGFFAVTMRKPVYPGVTTVSYYFAYPGQQTIRVDMQTGKVTPGP